MTAGMIRLTDGMTGIRGVNRGLEPPPTLYREKSKNWDIFRGKIVKFQKNTKFGAFL